MTQKAYPNPRTGQQGHNCPGCRQLINEAAGSTSVVFELCSQCGSIWIDMGTAKAWRYEAPATVPPLKRARQIRRQA